MTQSQVHYSQSDKMTRVIAALYTHKFHYFTYETKCILHLCQYNWINDSTTHCCSYCKLLYQCNVLIMITTTWWIYHQQLMCNLWILLVVLDLYQSVNTALYENTDTNKNRGSVLAGGFHICCTTHKNVKKFHAHSYGHTLGCQYCRYTGWSKKAEPVHIFACIF